MNTTISLSGNLIADPVFRRFDTGSKLTRFRLASSRRRRTDQLDKNGEYIWEDTDNLYIDVECWGELANNVGVSLKRGFPVTVTGRLVTDSWEEKSDNLGDSAPVVRQKIILKATQVSFDLSNFQVSAKKSSSVSNTPEGHEEVQIRDASEIAGQDQVEEMPRSAEDGAAPSFATVGAGATESAEDAATDSGKAPF